MSRRPRRNHTPAFKAKVALAKNVAVAKATLRYPRIIDALPYGVLAKLIAKHYFITMPRGSKGQRRPRDVISNAVHFMRLAIGEIYEDIATPEREGKDPAAVAFGRKGGKARAEGMTAKRRKEIARKAAQKRWGNK
jgi:hypothetical protein